ncbi:MAG: D-alanine--D-alanine ligase family protein [Eubacteriales bacterium]|nr:D-alanine--D-alanine ligase family protein [Eubacteriales bacterium]
MSKKTLVVLFGGLSSEHDVSCISAATVLRHADKEKYTVLPVGITKDGRWFLYESDDYDAVESGAWKESEALVPAMLSPDRRVHGLLVLRESGAETIRVDCVIPELHGVGGEDGTMQGLLELAGIPYVGPGVAASANSMDKSLTKILVQQAGGVRQAAFYLARRAEFRADPDAVAHAAEQALGSYPVFVKPCSQGSSVGVTKATDFASLKEGLSQGFDYDSKVLVEEFIDGHEIEVAVLGNEEPTATVAGEIAPSREFYSYEAKYVDGSSGLYIPAHISEDAMQRVRENAVRVYRALDCKGLSRVDFFCTYDGDEIVFNEINTLPGFTSISMYPKLQEYSGLPLPKLIDRLVELAMERQDG